MSEEECERTVQELLVTALTHDATTTLIVGRRDAARYLEAIRVWPAELGMRLRRIASGVRADFLAISCASGTKAILTASMGRNPNRLARLGLELSEALVRPVGLEMVDAKTAALLLAAFDGETVEQALLAAMAKDATDEELLRFATRSLSRVWWRQLLLRNERPALSQVAGLHPSARQELLYLFAPNCCTE